MTNDDAQRLIAEAEREHGERVRERIAKGRDAVQAHLAFLVAILGDVGDEWSAVRSLFLRIAVLGLYGAKRAEQEMSPAAQWVIRWGDCWIDPNNPCSAISASAAHKFSTEQAAREYLQTCNEGWQRNAVVERYMPTGQPSSDTPKTNEPAILRSILDRAGAEHDRVMSLIATWRERAKNYSNYITASVILHCATELEEALREHVPAETPTTKTDVDALLVEYDAWRNGRLMHMVAPDLCNRLAAALRTAHERAETWKNDRHLRAVLAHGWPEGTTGPACVRTAKAFLAGEKVEQPAGPTAMRYAMRCERMRANEAESERDALRSKLAAEDEANSNLRAELADVRKDLDAARRRVEEQAKALEAAGRELLKFMPTKGGA